MAGSPPKTPTAYPVTGASILAISDARAVIIRRGREPSKGLWALPGGRQEIGETMEMTARRELTEETGLTAGRMELIRIIEPMRLDEAQSVVSHYVLGVYLARDVSGKLVAGDDAADAIWVGAHDLERYEFTGTSLEILQEFLS